VATTRKAMGTIQSAQADPDLLTSLLSSRSESEAAVAFSLLRYSLSERELMQIANLREVIRLLPTGPFRAGESLEILERASTYEFTGRSYRRVFDSAKGVFGVEFLGVDHYCRGIVIHTPRGRKLLSGTDWAIVDASLLPLIVEHRILLDAILEALELLGCSLAPSIYVTVDDFMSEHGGTIVSQTFGPPF
jgi:hypothetical protein